MRARIGDGSFLWLSVAAHAAVFSVGMTVLAEPPSEPHPTSGPPPGARPHGPPKEAFEACQSKSEGDACTVALRDREITGSCVQGLDEVLFCMPDEPPPPPPGDRHTDM